MTPKPPPLWYEGMEPVRDCPCSACQYAVSIGSPYRERQMSKFDLLPQIEAEISAKTDPYMPALKATVPADGQWHLVQMYGRIDATGNVYMADFKMQPAPLPMVEIP